jgi:hypothetical protein
MHDPDANLTDEEITSLLFLREDPTAADLAMVFAAACEEQMRQRTLRGVELWQQGYVPRVLVTGGGVLARKNPEAQRMAQIAREARLPKECLLVEDQSSKHHGKRQALAGAAGTSRSAGIPQDGTAGLLGVAHGQGVVDGEEVLPLHHPFPLLSHLRGL